MLSIYLTWSHMITPERNNTVLASYITLFHQSLIERSLLPVFSTEIVVWLYFFSYWRFQFFIILADYPESINTVHQVSHLLQAFPQHLDRPPGDSICCQEQNLLLGHLIPSFWRIQPANSPDPIPRRLSLQNHQEPPDLPLQPQWLPEVQSID